MVDGSGTTFDWTADLGPVVETVDPGRRGAPLLICDHASAAIPEGLRNLGLSPADRTSHAAWDPGAAALARRIAEALGAGLALARVSRLVHDVNRPAGSPTAMPHRTEIVDIPGNTGLTDVERAARGRAVHRPFHAAVDAAVERWRPPAILTVHSFSPTWFGVPRAVELGLLHDADPALALAMLKAAPPGIDARLNEPYSAADGVTHTLACHGTRRGLPAAMIEVRNDLVADDAGVARMATILTGMVTRALAVVAVPT